VRFHIGCVEASNPGGGSCPFLQYRSKIRRAEEFPTPWISPASEVFGPSWSESFNEPSSVLGNRTIENFEGLGTEVMSMELASI
jgi:hypothetical protein